MIWAQIKRRGKMHLVYEAGEELPDGQVIRKDFLSQPICGKYNPDPSYRLTCDLPLAHACKNCMRIFAARNKPCPIETPPRVEASEAVNGR